MAIDKGAASLLLDLKKHLNFHGSICQLGRQEMLFDKIIFKDLIKKFNLDFKVETNDDNLKIDDRFFFNSIGFDDVVAADVSSYENAEYVFNLNNEVDSSLKNKFDFIYDGGTLEHVFNFPIALKNILKIVKKNGYIMHFSPANNLVDHGFYMFSPTAYYDFYSNNNFEIIKSCIVEVPKYFQNGKIKIYNYKPGLIDHLSYGGFGNKILLNWFVIKKTHDLDIKFDFSQTLYKNYWKEKKNKNLIQPTNKKSKIKNFIKSKKSIYQFLIKILILKIILKKIISKKKLKHDAEF